MIDRLTTFDLMFLRLESAAWPAHFGGLAILDGGALLDERGQVRMEHVLDGLSRRLARVPKLRQRLHWPGPLAGRPVWVDDPSFDVRSHVHLAHVPTPGDTTALLNTAARAYMKLLDRRQPLWELWLLEGAADGRVGVLLKLHHAVADGMAAVAVMDALFDPAPDTVVGPPPPYEPAPIPTYRALAGDNLHTRLQALRRAAAGLRQPGAAIAETRRLIRMASRYTAGTAAPASPLNQPVRPGRRVGYLTLQVAAVKDVAHAHHGKLNDIVLSLWAGGLRALLTSRDEPVDGVELITAMARTLRTASQPTGTSRAGAASPPAINNRTGAFVLPLPVGEPNPAHRLERVVATTAAIKTAQQPAAVIGLLASLAGTPLGRLYVTQQRANNTIVTNVPGPPHTVWFLGAAVREVLPIIELIGNVGLTLCAISYAGQLTLVVTADATAFPDLDALTDGMAREWETLLGPRGQPAP